GRGLRRQRPGHRQDQESATGADQRDLRRDARRQDPRPHGAEAGVSGGPAAAMTSPRPWRLPNVVVDADAVVGIARRIVELATRVLALLLEVLAARRKLRFRSVVGAIKV